jgi:hypothetical protein
MKNQEKLEDLVNNLERGGRGGEEQRNQREKIKSKEMAIQQEEIKTKAGK